MPPIRSAGKMDDESHANDAEHAPHVVDYTFLSELKPPPTEMKPFGLDSRIGHDNTPPPTPQRSSHGKRRDASYIPRPPNAFILFRSSFIRDQKVTSKVEGNHSNLSKIIGMYWRTLTKEQRNEWEAKAEQALIEHRKRYPDWRFRPAANASAIVQAKTKIKDGARRGRARKDPPDRGTVGGEEEPEESTGKGRAMTRAEEAESRLTKIAGLLVEGQEGEALERAVEKWETDRRNTRRSASVSTTKSASSSPVMLRASASTDREKTPSTFTLTLATSPSSSMSVTCSPVLSRAHALGSMDPDPSPAASAASEAPALTPSLSVSMSASSSSNKTCALTTERDPPVPCLNTPTPKHKPLSSPSTPRLSCSTLVNPPPSWPASPITPQSRSSTASRSLLWPPSPVTPCTPISFIQAEDWELGQSPTRSTSVAGSTSSSPVVTRASASTVNNGGLSRFLTRNSSLIDPELPTPLPTSALLPSPSLSMSIDWEVGPSSTRSMSIPASAPSSPIVTRASAAAVNSGGLSRASSLMDSELPTPPPTSALMPSPSLSMSMSMSTSSSRASTMEREPEPPSMSLVPSLSRLDGSAPSSSPPRTQHSSMLTSPSVPVPIPKWFASPRAASTSTATTSVPWLPSMPRISTSFPSSTREQEWERVSRSNSISKSALSSPAITHVPAASVTDGQPLTLSLVPAPSPLCVYTPSTPKEIPSPPVSTSTPPVPIPRPSPTWHASQSTPYAASTSVPWSASPVLPRISTSFPASTRAEEWEMGHRAARSNSASMSGPVSALSSPVTIRASTSTVDPAISNRASCSTSMKRTPALTPSWPSSPAIPYAPSSSVLRSPFVVQTHVPITPAPTPCWSNASTPPSPLPKVPNSTPTSTPTSSRRSRPRSRSPTFRSPENPNAPLSMKRSLSAPAPKRRYCRQQDPVRMVTGFWWPAPLEDEYSSPGREQEQEMMGTEMGLTVPTREGSFDAFASQNQETEHEYGMRGEETNECNWNWSGCDSDSKSTSTYSSNPVAYQITSTPTSSSTNPPYQSEQTSDEQCFNPWDVDTTVHAGESLHPLPPTPISPLSPFPFVHTATRTHSSSFSSLAGWDGTSTEPARADANGACAVVKTTMTGIGGMWGGEGGGLQRLGVQGGGYGEDYQWVVG